MVAANSKQSVGSSQVSAGPGDSGEKSVSARKRRANRRNARKSTGPRTVDGKARSRMNAWLHGVYAADSFLMQGESRALFLFQREALIGALKPVDAMELMFVEHLAIAKTRLTRLQKLAQEAHERQIVAIRRTAANDLCLLQQTLAGNFDEQVDYSQWIGEFADDSIEGVGPDDVHPFETIEESEELKKRALPLVRMLQLAKHQRIPTALVQYEQIKTADGLQRMDWFVRTTQRLELSFSRWMREFQKYRTLRLKQCKDQPEQKAATELDFLSDPEKLFKQAKKEIEHEEKRREGDEEEFPPNEPTGEQSTANEVNTTTSAKEREPIQDEKSSRAAHEDAKSPLETPPNDLAGSSKTNSSS